MIAKSLTEQIEEIDRQMATLDDQRCALIYRLSNSLSRNQASPKVLHFPNRVSVRRLLHGSENGWPKGESEAD